MRKRGRQGGPKELDGGREEGREEKERKREREEKAGIPMIHLLRITKGAHTHTHTHTHTHGKTYKYKTDRHIEI